MQEQKYEELETRASAEFESKLAKLEQKLQARRVVELEIEAMKAEGKAHEISDEEIRMIRSLRRFKATCKPGDVFRWQTRPVEGVTIHEDTSLIRDPQEVS